VAEAVKQSETAYEFAPGAYTHAAMVAIRTAAKVSADATKAEAA
jgi:hypothetical protein